MVYAMDPNNSVMKRLWCTCTIFDHDSIFKFKTKLHYESYLNVPTDTEIIKNMLFFSSSFLRQTILFKSINIFPYESQSVFC